MTEFFTPVDIGNRALQHCGVARMNYAEGFEENSKAASEVAFVYGKLRRAELRRNAWKFAIKRSVIRPIEDTSRLIVPAIWNGNTTYRQGALCADVQGNVWMSTAAGNINRPPGYAKGWVPYYGTLQADKWVSTESYYAGDVVYVSAGDGTYKVFLSLKASNTDVPGTPNAWASTTTYRKGDLVALSSVVYVSDIDLNLAQSPATTANAAWVSTTTYSAGQKVKASNGYVYSSVGGSNLNNDPLYDLAGTYWTNTGVLNAWTTDTTGRGDGSEKWQPLSCVLEDERPILPSLSDGMSVYRRPANFLRLVSQDPKAGAVSVLGAPTNAPYLDWNLEGDYIVTGEVGPLILRFVADVVDVTTMDDMFCEGLACRVGLEVCEPLTQSTGKKQGIASEYTKFMSEARLINAIEVGAEQPPIDDWISCRL